MAGNRKVLQAAATAQGVGEFFDVRAWDFVVFQVSGTFTGTVTFQGTLNGQNWGTVQVTKMDDGTGVTTAAAAGLFQLRCAGLADVRANITAYTDGAITVAVRGKN